MRLNFIGFLFLLPFLSSSCLIDDDCGYNVYCQDNVCVVNIPEWTTYFVGVFCVVFACLSFGCVHRWYGSWGKNALICFFVSLVLLGGSIVEFGWCPFGLGWGIVLAILALIFLVRGVHWSYMSRQPAATGYQPVGRPWGPWGRPGPPPSWGGYPPPQTYYGYPPQQPPPYYNAQQQQYPYYQPYPPQPQQQQQQQQPQYGSTVNQSGQSTITSNIQDYTTDGKD